MLKRMKNAVRKSLPPLPSEVTVSFMTLMLPACRHHTREVWTSVKTSRRI